MRSLCAGPWVPNTPSIKQQGGHGRSAHYGKEDTSKDEKKEAHSEDVLFLGTVERRSKVKWYKILFDDGDVQYWTKDEIKEGIDLYERRGKELEGNDQAKLDE